MANKTFYSTEPRPLYVEVGDPLTPGQRYEINGEPQGIDAAHIEHGRLAPVPADEPKTTTRKAA